MELVDFQRLMRLKIFSNCINSCSLHKYLDHFKQKKDTAANLFKNRSKNSFLYYIQNLILK